MCCIRVLSSPSSHFTDLTPFWKNQTTYWKSADIQQESPLNYTYPELLGNPTSNGLAVKVGTLYGGAAFGPGPVVSFASQEPAKDPSQEPSHQLAPSHEPSKEPSKEPSGSSITEWSVRITSKQFELGGSFSVLIFLGDVPANPKEWFASPTLVGSFDALVNSTPEVCANCQTLTEVEISGFVYLNEAIKNTNDDQASFHPDYVVPRLTKDLSWRVLKVSATSFPEAF